MNIGITGATGFLGSYLLNYFLKNNNYNLRTLTRTIHLANLCDNGKVSWQCGNLSSIKTCEDFVQGLDVVVHLAHTNIPLNCNRDLPSDAMENMVPSLNLIQAIRKLHHKPHFIYSSSGGEVYGSSKNKKISKESDICMPERSYGIQKMAVENYLRIAAEEGWLTATCLRIGNPYGVLLAPERMQGLIGVVLYQLVHRQPVTIFSSLENVRDYVHLKDMCRAFELVLSPRKKFEIFNVGSGKGHSVNQILEMLEKYCDRKILRRSPPPGASFDHLQSWVVLGITKAKAELGWEPLIDIEFGLKQLCNNVFQGI
jgi:UDP-glucose 4-epimerase